MAFHSCDRRRGSISTLFTFAKCRDPFGSGFNMRRDTLFFQLFKQFPELLFELMDNPPDYVQGYQFESVEVKETSFRLDGVFLPPGTAPEKVVCFAEVQFQKDEELYDRFIAEVSLFLRRSQVQYDDWRGLLLFGSRSLEPSNGYLHRSWLRSSQVQCLYLDELTAPAEPSMGIAVMRLTVLSDAEAVESARYLLRELRVSQTAATGAIIDLIITTMIYKLASCSQEEIEAMLGINLEDPRALREERAKGRQEGRQDGERFLVLRLLGRQVGEIPGPVRSQVEALSLEQLESLGEALLNFTRLEDLQAWLEQADIG
jgi:predicted transposase YdaD